MATDPVELDVRDGIARLTLDRPEANNALDGASGALLRRHAESLVGRGDVRVVVIAARGRMFCAGGDLPFFAGAEDPGATVHALASDFHAAQLALSCIDAPLITVVQGMAAGGGFGLAVSGDLVLAGASARFTLAYTKGGLTPDGGATWLLPRLVGLRKAHELILLNPVLGAGEALELGLVTRVVPDDELDATATAVAIQLAAGPRDAHGGARRLLRTAFDHTLEEHLSAEADGIAHQAAGPEGREGIAAFVEKRPPDFLA